MVVRQAAVSECGPPRGRLVSPALRTIGPWSAALGSAVTVAVVMIVAPMRSVMMPPTRRAIEPGHDPRTFTSGSSFVDLRCFGAVHTGALPYSSLVRTPTVPGALRGDRERA